MRGRERHLSLPAPRRRGDATSEVESLGGSRGRDAAAATFFFIVALWLTWPLGARLTTGLSSAPDALLNAWALAWSFHILPEAPLSLFDANIFAPRPDTLAYSEHLFGITILVLPLFLATGSLVLAYNTALFSAFVLSGIGMYLLVRDLTGDRRAALVAGTIFLAAPYRFGHLLQLQLVTYQWIPFLFWCLLRYLRAGGKRSLAGVVVFSALQLLSCNYYAVYVTYALALFGVVLLLFGRALLTRGKLLALAAGALAVFTLVLPFVLPYERNRERGFYRRYEDVVHFSASPADYLTPSSFNRTPLLPLLPAERRSEHALYPGIFAMLLAAAGAVAGARASRGEPGRRTFWVFGLSLTVAAVVLSLGPEAQLFGERTVLPYRFFYRHAPGFAGMRAPARLGIVALFGAALLAGEGAGRLLARARERARLAFVALIILLLVDYRTYPLDRVFPDAPEIPAAHRFLAEAPAKGAVLVLPIHEGEAIVEESRTMFDSTAHFRPLVNGYSGWWPDDYWVLVGRLRHFPTARTLRFLLERAPVRYVVVHYDAIPEPRRRQLAAGMERYRERMPVRFRAGDDVVYEILDAAEGE